MEELEGGLCVPCSTVYTAPTLPGVQPAVDDPLTKEQSSPMPIHVLPSNCLISWKGFLKNPCGSRNLGCCYRCHWWTWGYPESINNTISLCSFIIYLTSALSYCPSLSAQVSLCSFWRFLCSWPLLYRFSCISLQLLVLKNVTMTCLFKKMIWTTFPKPSQVIVFGGTGLFEMGEAGYRCNNSKENLVSG